MKIHDIFKANKKTTCIVMDSGGGILRESCSLCDWEEEAFFWSMCNKNYDKFAFKHTCKYSIKRFNIASYYKPSYTFCAQGPVVGKTEYTNVFKSDGHGRVVSIIC